MHASAAFGLALLGAAQAYTEFHLAMTVGSEVVNLNAVRNGTDGDIVFEAIPLYESPDYAAYLVNGTGTIPSESSALYLAVPAGVDGINAGTYGVAVPDVGDDYGYTASVTAAPGYAEFEYGAYDGEIYHTLFAAPNSWFACNDSVVGSGEVNYFLKFGDYPTNYENPVGCVGTTVLQNAI
ncbi:hypothetical protein GGR56DRAFT_74080 [Xylariaceae sp. FL0804]|nr:hypothetical protein GGR56DRAFT_74080 [Xylariaceae sp. FL0804]